MTIKSNCDFSLNDFINLIRQLIRKLYVILIVKWLDEGMVALLDILQSSLKYRESLLQIAALIQYTNNTISETLLFYVKYNYQQWNFFHRFRLVGKYYAITVCIIKLCSVVSYLLAVLPTFNILFNIPLHNYIIFRNESILCMHDFISIGGN